MPPHPNIRSLVLGGLTLAVLAGFAVGISKLFSLRFESGDVYPAYSTMNTSPRGASALFESLSDLEGIRIERNFLPLLRFKARAGTTLILAGADEAFFGDDTPESFDTFERFLDAGLHVVVALNPSSIASNSAGSGTTSDPWSRRSNHIPPPAANDPEAEEAEHMNAGERWGFGFERAVPSDAEPNDGFEISLPAGPDATPLPPRWFSPWRWASLGPDWQVLASAGADPVVVRRSFGNGSLTLASDSTFLSNEALARAPRPGFLLWLLVRSPHLVFDETFHGTNADPGIMHIVRRYRLFGFFVGAAVLLALFVWRASTSLVPAHESIESVQAGPISGAEGSAGLTNLLAQSVPPKSLLRTCFHEWAKSAYVRRRFAPETVTAVRDAVVAAESASRSRLVETYLSLHRLLARSRGA